MSILHHPHLRYELYDFDEDIKGRVSRHDSLGPLRKERVNDAGQAGMSGGVTLTFNTDHVHPQQAVKRLCCEVLLIHL